MSRPKFSIFGGISTGFPSICSCAEKLLYNTLMAHASGSLSELRLTPTGLAGRIDCPANLHPAPGQYLLASSNDPTETLPVPLFPAGLPQGNELPIAPPLPAHWVAGEPLLLRGPLGHGFSPPSTTRRFALAALQAPPDLLFPLCEQAVRQNASVALYTASPPSDLPAEVEISPLDLLPEALTWADYLAAVFPRESLAGFRRLAGLGLFDRLTIPAQALLLSPMPCGGIAECGVCAVRTTRGWQHACSDGPVFDLNTLEVE